MGISALLLCMLCIMLSVRSARYVIIGTFVYSRYLRSSFRRGIHLRLRDQQQLGSGSFELKYLVGSRSHPYFVVLDSIEATRTRSSTELGLLPESSVSNYGCFL
ncbi:hypothetical protein F5Y04DRAFT_238299 [Hypomontagnella monticulosa]|nr:hypothetical protein F5Y04DRAFT_238299 [Hypomontagnella monticulosa]